MVRSYFLALAATFLLPTFGDVSGAAYCPGGTATKEEVIDVLTVINDQRTSLVEGEAPSGRVGRKLPPAKGMTKISWNCDLEMAALKNVDINCPIHPLGRAPEGTTGVHHWSYDDPSIKNFVDLMSDALTDISVYPFTYSGGPTLKYDPNGPDEYQDLVRSNTTGLGCVFTSCTNKEDLNEYLAFYCLTNQGPLTEEDIVYEVGTGVCSGCPHGTFCDDETKLCTATRDAQGEASFTGLLISEHDVFADIFVFLAQVLKSLTDHAERK
ncbi:hypothetical protein Aduo_003223 [Ancylostoma duodenale]